MWEQALVSAEGNSCVANRMEGKMVIDRVKMWLRANVWGGHWGMEIVFCRELGRVLLGGGSLINIGCRNVCVSVC